MRCPFCNYPESKVLDSRPVNDGSSIRRRRECLECQKRFTTFEVLESVQIFVTKKNGETELFDRTKLLAGVLKATQKRPVNAEVLEKRGQHCGDRRDGNGEAEGARSGCIRSFCLCVQRVYRRGELFDRIDGIEGCQKWQFSRIM